VIRTLIIRLGIVKSTLLLTALACIVSILASILIGSWMGDHVSMTGLWMALIIPGIISPIFSVMFLRILIQLDTAQKQLQEVARRDGMTGIFNRTYFIEMAERELALARRYGHIFTIAILDVDDFKWINDTYGHLAGDQVLLVLTTIIRNNLRKTDVFARFGGDEFVILFPNTDEDYAQVCIQRFLDILARSTVFFHGKDIHFTVSVGTEVYCNQSELDAILHQADMALYRAKNQGKDQIVTHS
jgi:diguanylate cyclase (GGDEF)-like protein